MSEYTEPARKGKRISELTAERAFIVGATRGAESIASWIDYAAEDFKPEDWRELANYLRDREQMHPAYLQLLKTARVKRHPSTTKAVEELKRTVGV